MTPATSIRRRSRTAATLTGAGGLLAALALAAAACGGSSSSGASTMASSVGQPPPEWAANAGAWPAHNYDLSNTRATTQTPINSQTVSKLKVKWRFAFKGLGAFGAFASTPIVAQRHRLPAGPGLERLRAQPLDRQGQVEAHVQQPSVGPNGVSYGYGRIYGATETNAFALDAQEREAALERES